MGEFKQIEPLVWRNAPNMKEAEIPEWGELQINTRRYDYEGANRLHAWLTAALGIKPAVPEGFVLVPVIPTEDMLQAGTTAIADDLRTDLVWDSMLSASPQREDEATGGTQ